MNPIVAAVEAFLQRLAQALLPHILGAVTQALDNHAAAKAETPAPPAGEQAAS